MSVEINYVLLLLNYFVFYHIIWFLVYLLPKPSLLSFFKIISSFSFLFDSKMYLFPKSLVSHYYHYVLEDSFLKPSIL